MLRPRIIPCLLVQSGGLVKTARFAAPKYVGDPINAVRIFNEKQVDELIVLDIDATAEKREPDYVLIERLAEECRMPLCYGGGVKTSAQIERIVSLGVEKVALSSGFIDRPETVAEAARGVGNQSIVVVLDYKCQRDGSAQVYTHNGSRATRKGVVALAKQAQELGAGEIVLSSIDRDGVMQGYDLDLVERVRGEVAIPVTAIGGAGSLGDIEKLIRRCGIVGAAAGSLFVFKGVYRAVLINYPDESAKEGVLRSCGIL